MPIYEIEAPTGQIFELEGDSPPNEAELEQIFSSIGAPAQEVTQPEPMITPEEREKQNIQSVLERAATPEFQQRAAARKEQREAGQEMRDIGAYTTGALEGAKDFSRQLAQGATFGFGEEAEAALRASMQGVGGRGYEETLKDIRQEMQLAKSRSPGTALAAELVGGLAVPGAGAIGVVGKGATTLGKMARGALVGAPTAAAYGAGTAEEGERVSSALKAAPGGLVLGGILPGFGALAKGVGSVIRKATVGASPEQVLRSVGDVSSKAGMYADELEKSMKRGSAKILADLDKGVAGMGRALRKVGGETQDILEDRLIKRAQGETKRIAESLKKNVSGKAYFDELDEVEAVYKSMASKAYKKAFSEPPLESAKLDSLFYRSPTLQSALKKAGDIAADEGVDITQKGPGWPTRALDYVKSSLDELIDAQTDPLTNKVSKEGIRYVKLKSELMDEVKKLNPSYKRALETAGDSLAIKNAMNFGKKPGQLSGEQLKRKIATMSPAEKDAMLVGLKDNILETAQKAADSGSSAKRIIGTEFKREQIRALFDNDTQYKKFMKSMQDEIDGAQTYNKIMGGSQTDINLAEGGQLEGAVTRMRQGFLSGLADATVGKVANVIERRYRGITPKNAKILAEVVSDPRKAVNILRNIDKKTDPAQMGIIRRMFSDYTSAPAMGFEAGLITGQQ